MPNSTDARALKNLVNPTRYTIPDTRGLHLWVRADKKKYWIFRFTYEGCRYDMSLGSFPEVPLTDAREKVSQLKRQIYKGINPVVEKREHKQSFVAKGKGLRFDEFASNLIGKLAPQWSSQTHKQAWHRSVEIYANPIIGRFPVHSIQTAQILSVLEPIWQTKHVSASRLRGRLEKIISAAITTGFHKGPNPAVWNGHLENLLPHVRRDVKHFEALNYKDVPALIQKIKGSSSLTALALEFTILNATRAQETLGLERSEISGDIWTIPAARMKGRKEHQIPLGSRSLEIISKALLLDPESRYVFSKNGKCLTHTSMLHFLSAYGGGQTTVHGFRSSFRDWVSEETDHSSEVAEMSLAHAVKNKVEAAYRRGNLLQRRRLLMKEWEDYCQSSKVHENSED